MRSSGSSAAGVLLLEVLALEPVPLRTMEDTSFAARAFSVAFLFHCVKVLMPQRKSVEPQKVGSEPLDYF